MNKFMKALLLRTGAPTCESVWQHALDAVVNNQDIPDDPKPIPTD